jgi:hypothetical protein
VAAFVPRPDRTTTKGVDQLSEGTRDQLVLALRLVMLEDYAEEAPALPFIADGMLQTLDASGAAAGCLTRTTQRRVLRSCVRALTHPRFRRPS